MRARAGTETTPPSAASPARRWRAAAADRAADALGAGHLADDLVHEQVDALGQRDVGRVALQQRDLVGKPAAESVARRRRHPAHGRLDGDIARCARPRRAEREQRERARANVEDGAPFECSAIAGSAPHRRASSRTSVEYRSHWPRGVASTAAGAASLDIAHCGGGQREPSARIHGATARRDSACAAPAELGLKSVCGPPRELGLQILMIARSLPRYCLNGPSPLSHRPKSIATIGSDTPVLGGEVLADRRPRA